MVLAQAISLRRVTTLIAVLLFPVLLALASGCGSPQAPQAPAAQAGSPAQDEAQGDSVHVHGDWTVEGLEPDGRVASRHEFKNALLSGGKEALGKLLGRDNGMGLWTIVITSDSPLDASQKPCTAGLDPSYCSISEPTSAVPASGVNTKNLEVQNLFTGVRLKGNVTADRTGALNRVQTNMALCLASVAPDNPCNQISDIFFSSRTLATPITFEEDQIIQVTVDITFS